MIGIASVATSVLIGYLVTNTITLHPGSDGAMLSNHPSLVIVEQFGTLNTLYPGRTDLRLGHAPGSDQPTTRALHRHMSGDIDNLPRDVAELVDRSDVCNPSPHVHPVPGYGEQILVWLLGSNLYSIQLVAQLDLPLAFASHFAPDMLHQALHLYRTQSKPSVRLAKSYAIVCINIIATDSNRDAKFLSTFMQRVFVRLCRGEAGQLSPPVENMRQLQPASEQYGVRQALNMLLAGDKAKVWHGLDTILYKTQVDGIMVDGQTFGHQARLYPFDLATDVKQELLGQYYLCRMAVAPYSVYSISLGPVSVTPPGNCSTGIQATDSRSREYGQSRCRYRISGLAQPSAHRPRHGVLGY